MTEEKETSPLRIEYNAIALAALIRAKGRFAVMKILHRLSDETIMSFKLEKAGDEELCLHCGDPVRRESAKAVPGGLVHVSAECIAPFYLR